MSSEQYEKWRISCVALAMIYPNYTFTMNNMPLMTDGHEIPDEFYSTNKGKRHADADDVLAVPPASLPITNKRSHADTDDVLAVPPAPLPITNKRSYADTDDVLAEFEEKASSEYFEKETNIRREKAVSNYLKKIVDRKDKEFKEKHMKITNVISKNDREEADAFAKKFVEQRKKDVITFGVSLEELRKIYPNIDYSRRRDQEELRKIYSSIDSQYQKYFDNYLRKKTIMRLFINDRDKKNAEKAGQKAVMEYEKEHNDDIKIYEELKKAVEQIKRAPYESNENVFIVCLILEEAPELEQLLNPKYKICYGRDVVVCGKTYRIVYSVKINGIVRIELVDRAGSDKLYELDQNNPQTNPDNPRYKPYRLKISPKALSNLGFLQEHKKTSYWDVVSEINAILRAPYALLESSKAKSIIALDPEKMVYSREFANLKIVYEQPKKDYIVRFKSRLERIFS